MAWDNKQDYVFPSDMSLDYWAWQFLRRNKEYKNEWESALEIYKSRYIKNKKINLSELEYIEPSSFLALHGFPFSQELKDWGFGAGFYNPLHIMPQNLKFKKRCERPYLAIDIEESKNRAHITFDITLPLEPQLKNAKLYLKKIAKERGIKPITRKHKIKWRDYLIVYDACQAEIEPNKIAKVVFPKLTNDSTDQRGTKRVFSTLKQAEKLVNGDYITIPIITLPLPIYTGMQF